MSSIPPPPPTSATDSNFRSRVIGWVRRNFAWIVVGIVVVVLGSAIGGISIYAQNKVDDLRAEKRSLDTRVNNVSGDRDQQKERAESAESELKKLQDEIDNRRAELDEREAGLDEQASSLDKRKKDLDEREEEVSAAEEVKAQNTFGDGTRTVGVDIEPGTYRADDVGSRCYWAILRTGSNGDDIVENDLPGGGSPSVSLSEGQDFKSLRCGEWTLID